MRTLLLPALAVASLAACDGGQLTEPHFEIPAGLTPELSVVVFGVTPLGVPDAGTARAVNDLGQVIGTRQTDNPSGGTRPWLYENGTWRELSVPAGTLRSSAAGLNPTGMVVGNIDLAAAAWTDAGHTILATGFDPLTHVSDAEGVNGLGQIVGHDSDAVTGTRVALFWEGPSDQSPMLLQSPDGEDPLALNDAGVIVGLSFAGGRRAVAWPSPTEAPRTLKGFDGAPCAGSFRDNVGAFAVNQVGAIVGACLATDGLQHAAYWSGLDAIAIDLEPGTVEGSVALEVNELGQVVGGADGAPVLWVREGNVFRRFELGTPGDAGSGHVNDISNTGYAAGGAGGAVLWEIPIQGELDVVPGDPANRVKLDGRGRIKVAVLGSRWLQVAGIDPLTLTLGNDDGQETPVAQKKKLTPAVTLTDVNRDGRNDLVAEFEESALMANGDLAVGTATVVLLGRFRNGKHLRGAGTVQASR